MGIAAAAHWHARLSAPDCTHQERAQLECWRRQDPAHEQAFRQAAAVSLAVQQLAATERMQALARAAYEMGRGDGEAMARARRWAVPAALAATILVAVVGTRLASYLSNSQAEVVPYVTDSGERRDLTLADGSVVHLDVASELNVQMTRDQRRVEVTRGRALFEVAHDASRPFSVIAGNSRTTALGTHFQVQREDERVLVTLVEGSVAVSDISPAAAWQQRLKPGEQLRWDSGSAAPEVVHADVLALTSWSRGRLVFRDTPLGEAVREVNRYARAKVRLGDPALASLRVSGNFIAGDSTLIVAAFTAVLPLHVVDGGDNELILFRRYDDTERH